MDDEWREDVLGVPFERTELPLGEDDEGPVVATLVRVVGSEPDPGTRAMPLDDVDVLYVHGWSDYFFQVELAERIEALGAHFYALDLRKYGRSLLPGQSPGFTADLSLYDADIEAALALIARSSSSKRRLVLLGHSTGGLTLSLWAARHPDRVAAVVLNSPWLEFQAASAGRRLLTPGVKLGAQRDPLAPMPIIDQGFYTRTVSDAAEGSWTYDLQWRPERGFALRPGWLAAIFAGQAEVARGLAIPAPVLVMTSSRSMLQPRWNEDMTRSDVALNVDLIAHRALSLGDLVTVARIEDALHDVFLSAPTAREHAYQVLEHWLRGMLRR